MGLEVIGAGIGRTGTISLKVALEQFIEQVQKISSGAKDLV